MAKISLFSPESFKKKFVTFLALGLAGLCIYGTAAGISGMGRFYGLNHRAGIVKKAMKSKDFEAARRLLNSFKEKKALRAEDEVKLELMIGREEEKYRLYISETKKFEETLKTNNLDSIYSAFRELQNSGNYSKRELTSLEERIYNSTEAGLFKKISSSDDESRRNLCQDYLRLYPNGANKKRVIEVSLVSSFGLLISSLEGNEDFQKTYSQLSEVTDVLKKYSDMNIGLSEVVSIKKAVDTAHKYLERTTTITEIQKNQFEKEIRRLNEFFINYYTTGRK